MIVTYTYVNERAKPELADLIKAELDARWERIIDTAERVARKKYRQKTPVVTDVAVATNNEV